MARVTEQPKAGLRFKCPHSGEEKTVTWASDGHIQFSNGTCCDASDWLMFYRGAEII